MTIREVEEALHVTRANVRFYEKEGLIAPKRNPINDYRDYSTKDVETLRRILYLRSLEVSIEDIRKLTQGKKELSEVLGERREQLRKQEMQTREAALMCEKLLGGQKCTFWDFPMEEVGEQNRSVLLRDTLTKLGMFWDQLVVWGFLALQLLYTVIVFPMLPAQIPVTWNGAAVTEYGGKGMFLVYVALSIFLMLAVKKILYARLVGGLRCYLEELGAMVSVGMIGYGFSLQVYTVLSLQGVLVGIDAFLMGCIICYLLVIALIVLIYRHYKKGAAA